ncbi:aquaporin, partial [Staphylococcus epidermidis]|uniref:aquaporin n=1 Tax=Staphylococcus epidermidis TaxID=1282 RepID=UPI0016425B9F
MNGYLGEFLGSGMVIVFGGGVCGKVKLKRSGGKGGDWIVIGFGWGLGVRMGVYGVGRFCGGHLNGGVRVGLGM